MIHAAETREQARAELVERWDRERIMFLRNERGLEVKNDTLATIETVSPEQIAVRTDDGRSVAFDTKDYAHVYHGYAATFYKAQGMSVHRSHMIATPEMERHGAYVGMTRHRNGMALHYGRDDFIASGRTIPAGRAGTRTAGGNGGGGVHVPGGARGGDGRAA